MFTISKPENYTLLELPWVPFVLLTLASICDLQKREIPDWIWMVLLVWVGVCVYFEFRVVFTLKPKHVPGELTWRLSLLGLVIGFCLSMLVCFFDLMGGGDVKLLAALGAYLGPVGFVLMFFYTGVIAAVVSIIASCFKVKEIPYAPAITAGFLTLIVWRTVYLILESNA